MGLTDVLPHVNAGLNLIATVLLITGWRLIKQKRKLAHRNVMLCAFGVSCLFLIGYLANRALAGDQKFPAEKYPLVAWFYWAFLAAHVLLAITVPFLAGTTIVLALGGNWSSHRKLAQWTFPIWLYVSVSGVLVYLMLRWIFVP